jgi:hypothetical protein
VTDLGFVIVEYRQMSSLPNIADGELWHSRELAEEYRDALRGQAATVGRSDSYHIATVTIAEADRG